MQEFIQIYDQNRTLVNRFLIQTIRNNGEYLHSEVSSVKQFYNIFKSLELVYITDVNYVQTSSNIFRQKVSKVANGKNRRYLLSGIQDKDEFDEQNKILVTEPYVSSASGEACVTLIVACKDGNFYFFDFNLSELLSGFGLVERHPTFNFISKAFYFVIGVSMMFFSVMSIGYAFYEYGTQLLSNSQFSLESTFTPIIALTLGLAIFDLAKTLLEREVVYKAYADKKDEERLISKFLIAIIIALSIESLLVVFKTALHDPTQMLYALYLIIGVALIIISLAIFSFTSARKYKEVKQN